jgi:diguanylate cyclase (GGDEF)-like protein
MGLYRLFCKVWRNSAYSTKLLVVAVFGTHALLSSAIVWIWAPIADPKVMQAVVITERVVSLTLTIWMLWALLAPIRASLAFLEEYDRSGRITELPTGYTDEVGRLMAMTHRVVTELHDTVGELAKASTTDSLTGLHNRRFAADRLQQDLRASEATQRAVTLAVIDLDDLKATNTEKGHQGGDESLRGLAKTLRSEVRREDWIARWGGDEFLALFWDATPGEVSTRLAEIQKRLADDGIRFSAGLALIDRGTTAEEALALADA